MVQFVYEDDGLPFRRQANASTEDVRLLIRYLTLSRHRTYRRTEVHEPSGRHRGTLHVYRERRSDSSTMALESQDLTRTDLYLAGCRLKRRAEGSSQSRRRRISPNLFALLLTETIRHKASRSRLTAVPAEERILLLSNTVEGVNASSFLWAPATFAPVEGVDHVFIVVNAKLLQCW